MEQTKLTFKIYEPLLDDFEKNIDRLCLKRDAFLNHVLRTEVDYLKKELGSKRQSAAARKFISGELKRLGTHTINVVVDKDVAAMLNEVVDSSNMVRDAFANRLLMFLRCSPKMLNYLDLPLNVRQSNFDYCIDDISTSPLLAMEEIFRDPMYYLRVAIEERNGVGPYMLNLPEKLIGFTCYLSDDQVPGTLEQRAAEELSNELLRQLDKLESLAFIKPLQAISSGVKK
ncbi:hypothetical protein ACFOKJ_16760 [Vogesella amnigena]|uniref:Uncharacterized protein n=1 Tax=Vogesella amnigena TaxID=1507449 RepID=A0ABV7TYI6_9NEIS